MEGKGVAERGRGLEEGRDSVGVGEVAMAEELGVKEERGGGSLMMRVRANEKIVEKERREE